MPTCIIVKISYRTCTPFKSVQSAIPRCSLAYLARSSESIVVLVRSEPVLELLGVSGEPFDVLRDGLESFGTTVCTGTGLGIFLEEGLHLVQLRLRGERSCNGRHKITQIPVVQCISIHQELPIVAHPVPH